MRRLQDTGVMESERRLNRSHFSRIRGTNDRTLNQRRIGARRRMKANRARQYVNTSTASDTSEINEDDISLDLGFQYCGSLFETSCNFCHTCITMVSLSFIQILVVFYP